MQPLNWYYRRLRGSSAKELAWRVNSLLRDTSDRALFSVGAFPRTHLQKEFGSLSPAFRVTDMAVGEWNQATGREAEWRDAIAAQAEQIASHRLSFFDLRQKHLGDPIDWNRDHSSGKAAPMKFASSIDYRDFQETGDCKLVWEPNRHHHLVVLARAYRATGRAEFAKEVVAQLESWLQQCPFGIGMNWRSPLEFGVRLINQVWAIDLISESGLVTGNFLDQLMESIQLHIWSIARAYSQGSSANNHTIGEAAGVYIAASYFSDLSKRDGWRQQARQILIEQLFEQTFEEGSSREQAFGYHLFVLWLFFLSAHVGRLTGDDFPADYWDRIEKMMEFAAALSEAGTQPYYGDGDDAYVLDLGATHGDIKGLLSLGAIVFARPDFKQQVFSMQESSRWLLGKSAKHDFDVLSLPASPPQLLAHSFQQAGFFLLQAGETKSAEAISILFDCGELGFRSIAAHGHADALSFTLSAFGSEIFVDPGTYDYFTYPEWRNYFRSTKAHNTVEVDQMDQSALLGPFLWGDRAHCRLLEWKPRVEGGGLVRGEHDGYSRLADPVIHTRTVELKGHERKVVITDELRSAAAHCANIYFHLGASCQVTRDTEHRILIEVSGKRAIMECDPALRVEVVKATADSKLGWISRGYHSRVASTTLVLTGTFSGMQTWRNIVSL